jgi:membrane associated rhomboid family serine protease
MFNRKSLKMCQACRALIAADATVCPLCGVESHQPSGGGQAAGVGFWSVNTILITVNLAVYALLLLYQMEVVGQPQRARGLDLWSPSSTLLQDFGAVYQAAVLAGQYWRLIAACFLHAGLLHIGFNCYALFQIGGEAEEVYGRAKYLCLYLVSGITSSLAVVISDSAAVGASGAVFGVIGAMAVYGYKRGGAYGQALKSSMIQWLIYGLIISFMPGISLVGHVGGLLGGAAMAYFIDDAEQTNRSLRRARWWQAAAALAVVLIAGSFALAAIHGQRLAELRRRIKIERSLPSAEEREDNQGRDERDTPQRPQ